MPQVLLAAIPGVISAGASIFGASQANKGIQNAANSNNALMADLYGQTKDTLNPFIQQGYQTNPLIAGALGYGDPNQAKNAFDAFRNSTGYNFQLQQGTNAVNQNAVTSGLLRSGANLKNLSNYGQNMAQQSFGDWLSRLTQQQGVGLNAGTALAGFTQNYGQNVSSNNNMAAGANANAWGQYTNAFNKGVNGLSGLFGYGGGGSSFGGGGGGG